MTKLLLSIVLLISLNAFCQTEYDLEQNKIIAGNNLKIQALIADSIWKTKQITSLKNWDSIHNARIVKLIADSVFQAAQIKVLQGQSSVYSARTNALIADTVTKWKEIRILQGQVSNLGGRMIEAEKDIKTLQDTVNVYKSKVGNLASRMIAQEKDSTEDGKDIRALQKQVAIYVTLSATGVLKLVKIGTLSYELRMDSAFRFNNGYMSKLKWNQVEDLLKRMAQQEKINAQQHQSITAKKDD